MEEQESNGGHNPGGYLRQGANVEVCIKEKGSEGAWFPATILESPTNPSASKRKTFTSSKVLIQYKTLVSEQDPTKLHVEHTIMALLRPAPPAVNAERLEQNDVVDAFYLDGWWPGVVMSVVGKKYRVGFRNPPDVLELEGSGLRSHWDWDNGAWTRAPRKVLKGSNYEPGTAVEVNLQRNHLWFSWLPAFFIGQLGDDSFLVQYRYKTPENGNENGVVKVVVADHQIRPRPPQQEENDFVLSQMVDAFYDMDIRCHLEWVDKHWTVWTSFSEFRSTKDYGAQLRHVHESSSNSVGKTPCHTNFRMKQLSPLMDKLLCGKTTGKFKISQHLGDDSRFLSPSPCEKLKGKESEDTSSLPQSYQRNTPAKTSKRKILYTNEETNEQQQEEQVDSLAVTVVKTGRQANSQFVKRGRKVMPRKLHDSNGSKIEYIEDEAIRGLHAGNTCLLPVKDIDHDNEDGVSSRIIGKGKLAELLVQLSNDPAADCMNDVLEKPAVSPRLNQNLATYQRKKRFQLKGVKNNATGVITDVEISKTNVVEHRGDPAGTVKQEESPDLPFVKLSPLWEHFESMEAFKKFPQKPHFRPLAKMKDIFREGSAIGRFDVKAIRHWLTELLDIKVKLGQLQNRSQEVKTRITRSTHDTATYEETITGIDKKIKDLQEKRMLAVSMKEVKDSEVSQSQAELTAINEDIQRISGRYFCSVFILKASSLNKLKPS
ncbi:hypothetical protein ACLB2K_071308 [Fragaria x ananassa]